MSSLPSVAAHQRDPHEIVPDPYRVFFPLGILAGLVGVGIWPFYALGWVTSIQSYWHIDIQLHGFLFAFVLGFLMTALPRFSQTWHATRAELVFFGLVYLLGNFSTGFGYPAGGYAAFLLNLTALLGFAIRRFRKRKANPPAEFSFVGVALLLGWFAALIRLLAFWIPELAGASVTGRRLLTEGMMLLLILGIGGKLMPMFFGHVTFLNIGANTSGARAFTKEHAKYLAIALCLMVSFLIEYFLSEAAGLWMRLILASFVFLGTMRLYRKPVRSGILVWVLWFANWAVYLGLWGAAIHPLYRVEVLHVMFIGGFGAMILGIATRVILSHGGYPVELEQKSKALLAAACLLAIALGVRIVSTFLPENYFPLLGIAGALWWIGLLVWGSTFSWRAVKLQAISAKP